MTLEARGEESVECRFWMELERRTNARKVAAKCQRYSGHFLRLLEEERRCAISPVLVVRFDPREDGRVGRTPGKGAESLSARVRDALLSQKEDNHYLALGRRLSEIDDDLDPGRMFVLCDWWSLYAMDYSSPLFPVSPLVGVTADGEPVRDTDFRAVIREWHRTTGAVERSLARVAYGES